LNKVDIGRCRGALALGELEVRELLTEYEFPGDDTVVRGLAPKALEASERPRRQCVGADGRGRHFVPSRAGSGQPFLMPIEDVFLITGRGTVVTGKVEQGQVTTGDEVEIVGIRPTHEDHLHRCRDVPQALDQARPRQHRACSAATKKEEVERGQGPRQAPVASRRTASSRARCTC
jgi:elongation factor Tu